ncbi:MAG: 30S ribosomal protein S4 [Candidatus Paceibacterota bacterium]
MKIGPKFKIAKRLGAPIFEKTQTQKFALSAAKASDRQKKGRRPGMMSDFKKQLIEKQKMRFSYGITEKQLRKYVDESLEKSSEPIQFLISRLESRLDNVAYRLGLAPTRRAARQMASHGHLIVNGHKSTIPSQHLKPGDIVTVRGGSQSSVMFTELAEKHSGSVPAWLTFDIKKLEGKVNSVPTYEPTETLFDPEQVFEFYSR